MAFKKDTLHAFIEREFFCKISEKCLLKIKTANITDTITHQIGQYLNVY